MKHMRKALAVALITLMTAMSGMPANAVMVNQFTDVSPTAWYAEAVDWAVKRAVFMGTGENTFSPETGMTRAMFVTVLGRMAGAFVARTSTSFSDVAPTAYYAPYVEWAKENGIVSGTGPSTFSPSLPLTREQAAGFLYRYALWLGMDPAVTGTVAGFLDRERIPPMHGMPWPGVWDMICSRGVMASWTPRERPQGPKSPRSFAGQSVCSSRPKKARKARNWSE